jgi:diguanylate cyclase (GGDEF)-like protein/PAS domain S-box-containing protein
MWGLERILKLSYDNRPMAKPDQASNSALDRLDPGAAFAAILNNGSIAVLMVSLDGRIIYANDACCRMMGFAASELTALRESDLIHSDDAETSRHEYRLLADGETSSVDFKRRYVRKNGEALRTKGSASLQSDKDTGEPLFIISLITDVTGEHTQEKVATLYARLEIALTASRIGVWEIDFVNEKLEWDARMRELYGLSEGESCSPAEWQSLLHPDDEARVMAEWERCFAGSSHFESQFRICRRDGEVRHFHALAQIFRDETGKPQRAIGANWDVTERQVLIEKVLAEKERLNITLYSIGDAVICTDAAALVTFMNPVAERLTGLTASEATARPVTEVFNIIEESSGKTPASPVDLCMREGRAFTIESGTILMGHTGDAYDIGFSAAPVMTAARNVIGSIVIFNDVTKDRANQKQVARSAYHDALTGLPNRVTFMIKAQSALNEAKEEGRSHALCFIDLDRFKVVNDRGGHAAGDALLCHVAKIIALSSTSKDVPARLGGDEFALLIRDCSAEEAEAAANAMVEAISSMEFRWETQLFRVGASIGATMVTQESNSLAEILDEADRACYSAKNSGRGQVCIRKKTHSAIVHDAGRFRSKSTNVH